VWLFLIYGAHNYPF